MSARDRILERIRATVVARGQTAHPGSFVGSRPHRQGGAPVERFAELFQATGGEVELHTVPDARDWLAEFSAGFGSVAIGVSVPEGLRPELPVLSPDRADLGVSMAVGAIAETGSLVLDARDGRRTQLLTPTHVVFLREGDVHETFREALHHHQGDLPSAIGLHSGPSKSADIGRYLVRGVHGPGRVIAVVLRPPQ